MFNAGTRRRFGSTLAVTWLSWMLLVACAHAQDDHQHADGHSVASIKPPKLFLDKSPKIVEYQLKRLSNAELLLAERADTDAKYIPVHAAILARAGIPSGQRRAAAEALAKLKSSSVVSELLAALDQLRDDSQATSQSARDLLAALLAEDKPAIQTAQAALRETLGSPSPWARRAALTARLWAHWTPTSIDPAVLEKLQAIADESESAAIDWLVAISWLPQPAARNALRDEVLRWLDSAQPMAVRQAAITTLATISVERASSFELLAKLVDDSALGSSAIRTMLTIPAQERRAELAQDLVARLVQLAQATPIDRRSGEAFMDTAQLAESLLPALPAAESRIYRERLRAVAVRVVRVRTVEEEMRYDVKYFAIEAGRPVEIVLINDDLMPHNLVITQPGKLKEVAFQAASMAPDEAPLGKQYVPQSDQVLWATGMVAAHKQERLAFEAPSVPGEYPFVCTFPNHWMRMYGVMVVVEDLDAWQKNPHSPADPIGNNRSFVQKWQLSDLADKLPGGLRGRTAEIGARLFQEATCLQCHKMAGQGGAVGPELTDLALRFKGDQHSILQEILDPSHKIDPKYAVQQILTGEGKVYTGIVVEETPESLSMIASPDQPKPTVIAIDNIEERSASSKSLMPTGLLDQFTEDEIFEILAYLIPTAPQ